MSALVTHFTTQLPGGVGNATQRLHRALCRAGVESRICFGAGESVDSTMIPAFQNRTFFWRNVAALATSWRSRQETPGGFVTGPGWIRKTPIQAIGRLPQVVHFHWVARWLDLPSFFASLPPGLPVVWTVRDLIPITGGCHYPGECDHFTRQCGNCPQQKWPHPWDATRKFFRTKERCYSGKNLHFVGNSEWTTAQIRRSGLAKFAKSIRTIHNGLDVEQYKPVDKSIARKALGIPEGRLIIGFACLDFNERRKGAEILMEALKTFPAKEIVLLILGAGKWPMSEVETITMGSLGSPRLQSVFYSALDVFAMPSLVETFGNTTIEAMACQTPVVAYPAGGVADVVADGETGLMEPEIGSVAGLVRMLHWMWKHPAERVAMGIAARQRVIEKFSDSLMARHHMDLYHELIPTEKSFLVNSKRRDTSQTI
jgi:glycosyltransferase involved in cell wall biosynthesis